MRKLDTKWRHRQSGEEYVIIDIQPAKYGSHEFFTLEAHNNKIVRSNINLYEDFQPSTKEQNNETQ